MERLTMTRRTALARAAASAFGVVTIEALATGRADAAEASPVAAYSAEVPAAWFDLALGLVRTTPGYSPPVAARALGYAGVALYEALVPGMPDRDTFAGRLNGLTRPTGPRDAVYHWPTVASSTLASILRTLFPTAPAAGLDAIDELERRHLAEAGKFVPLGVHRRSVERGATVARHVFDWSTTDGGHEGFRNNFPPYTPPSGAGRWEPTPPGFLRALQPYWGSNRPFLLPSGSSCQAPPPLSYSENPSSSFYAEGHDCYMATTQLTSEQETIARFWSDDPGATATPPGHSISILTQVIRGHDLPLDRAADAYARVGIAVADAFVACWNTKYEHNLLRPVTYIRRVIDPGWTPLLVTPPFPEYTSGHSVQSGAAAQVLTDLFGPLAFTDRTHESRGLPARSFGSFLEAAQEAAISRLYGGIHFRTAIERGLEQGICIARHVSAL